MKPILFLLFICAHLLVSAQLQSGPMLGYSEMKEVAIWVQTTTAAEVYIQYTDKSSKEVFKTKRHQTTKEGAYTATLIADQVLPGRNYDYDVFVNDQKVELDVMSSFKTNPIWRYRTDPPEFSFLMGSCSYISDSINDRPGRPYGGDYQIFTHMAKENADFMLWLGDNIYLREPDYFTLTGMHYRYTHARSLPELKNLLANMHHYAIWDDHDFGPNDADASFIHKDKALQAFKNFWANPSYGLPESTGISSFFEFNDLHFFLLDNRYFRTPILNNEADRYILGEEQVEWLINALKYSRAPFKFVVIGGQFLNTAAVYENHAVFGKERDYILQRLKEENIKGVIFLDGDRHHSEISKLESDGQLIYDITCSPLSSRAVAEVKEKNDLLIPESMVNERNYAILNVSGKRNERVLKVTFKNSNGKDIYSYSIAEKEWEK